jgi:NAD-dependent deacetylase
VAAPVPARSAGGEAVGRLAELVRGARSVVALTGAGISVPSGIPDFRTPGTGLWERVDPLAVAHIDAFREDPVRFWSFYSERFATLAGKRPNAAHRALVTLESAGLLRGVVTQNVDQLHRAAGSRELVEVHGSIATCSCLACRCAVTLAQAQAMIAGSDDGVPRCERCHEPLKPDVVLFGELLPERAIARVPRSCAPARTCCCASAPRSRCTPSPGCRCSRAPPAVRWRSSRRARRRSTSSPRCASTATSSPSSRRCSRSSASADAPLAQRGRRATVSRYSACVLKAPSSASLRLL